jgi:hypothetical protein
MGEIEHKLGTGTGGLGLGKARDTNELGMGGLGTCDHNTDWAHARAWADYVRKS